MIIVFIILAICICFVALFLQYTNDRRILALVYALFCVTHMIACANFEGFWYFFSAGVFDLAIISTIYAFNARIRLTDDLINICVLSIILNTYGFVTWYNSQPILSYQLTMVALYFIAILSLLRKDCADGNQLCWWSGGIRRAIDKGVAFCHTKQQEAEN